MAVGNGNILAGGDDGDVVTLVKVDIVRVLDVADYWDAVNGAVVEVIMSVVERLGAVSIVAVGSDQDLAGSDNRTRAGLSLGAWATGTQSGDDIGVVFDRDGFATDEVGRLVGPGNGVFSFVGGSNGVHLASGLARDDSA